jgi:hypothetical protein
VTLADTLDAESAALGGVERRATSGGTEWTVGGTAFAAAVADTAEFRLGPVVATAARNTPDVAASSRGSDWVAFTPRELDRYSIDRAVAWFGSAYRNASWGAGPHGGRESRRPR